MVFLSLFRRSTFALSTVFPSTVFPLLSLSTCIFFLLRCSSATTFCFLVIPCCMRPYSRAAFLFIIVFASFFASSSVFFLCSIAFFSISSSSSSSSPPSLSPAPPPPNFRFSVTRSLASFQDASSPSHGFISPATAIRPVTNATMSDNFPVSILLKTFRSLYQIQGRVLRSYVLYIPGGGLDGAFLPLILLCGKSYRATTTSSPLPEVPE
mmetsp:Transcript_20274/g.25618  ORF Transcript_20274/g.25618 Transcript_20274/m.25618 type:complete len:210 (+) Transcript_20274:2272-2901(+)